MTGNLVGIPERLGRVVSVLTRDELGAILALQKRGFEGVP